MLVATTDLKSLSSFAKNVEKHVDGIPNQYLRVPAEVGAQDRQQLQMTVLLSERFGRDVPNRLQGGIE